MARIDAMVLRILLPIVLVLAIPTAASDKLKALLEDTAAPPAAAGAKAPVTHHGSHTATLTPQSAHYEAIAIETENLAASDPLKERYSTHLADIKYAQAVDAQLANLVCTDFKAALQSVANKHAKGVLSANNIIKLIGAVKQCSTQNRDTYLYNLLQHMIPKPTTTTNEPVATQREHTKRQQIMCLIAREVVDEQLNPNHFLILVQKNGLDIGPVADTLVDELATFGTTALQAYLLVMRKLGLRKELVMKRLGEHDAFQRLQETVNDVYASKLR